MRKLPLQAPARSALADALLQALRALVSDPYNDAAFAAITAAKEALEAGLTAAGHSADAVARLIRQRLRGSSTEEEVEQFSRHCARRHSTSHLLPLLSCERCRSRCNVCNGTSSLVSDEL